MKFRVTWAATKTVETPARRHGELVIERDRWQDCSFKSHRTPWGAWWDYRSRRRRFRACEGWIALTMFTRNGTRDLLSSELPL
jgi:hypothetical protein